MLTLFPTSHTDLSRMLELFSWAAELQQSYSGHSALIVASQTISESEVQLLLQAARHCGFSHVSAIKAKDEDPRGWPWAPGQMFRMAAECVASNQRCPFYWVESDAIPVKAGWLDAIQAEYVASRKPFLGAVYDHPFRHINGSCVYPSNIRKHNPYVFNSEFFGAPWDTVRAELTLKVAHPTKLIVRSLEDPLTNEPHTFPDQESLAIIPGECFVFHGNKDGSLIARLREAKNPTFVPPPKPTFIEKIVNGAKRLITGENTYVHAGNLGDVVYAMPAIKTAGGGDLIICPEQRKTALCAVPIDKKQFEMLLPLLKAQPYLKNISYSMKYPQGARDLNHFRNWWNNAAVKEKHKIKTLCACHFYELGILNEFDPAQSWLACPQPIQTGKVIVHRSPRYQSPPAGPQSFPWQRLVDEHHEEMVFVGLESEHDAFCRMFGKKLSFWRVKSFLELAQLIAGGRCCVMNQSFPLSVALGLGQRVIVEALPRSPDCRFNRENYHDQLLGEIGTI